MFRVGVLRLLSSAPHSLKNVESISVRNLTRMSIQKLLDEIEPRHKKPAPFDYKKKRFSWYHHFIEGTIKRFDERTKVFVIEGPIASGKSELAKFIAEEFDFEYYPEANQDMYYINSYGFDLRKLDPEVPESCRSFDINNFLLNPRDSKVADFQMNQMRVKLHQYMDALSHLLNTGQGIVLDRCVYSDFVFMETMCKHGYLSKEAREFYYKARSNSLFTLLRPHLIIYMDMPVPKVLENIKKRNYPYEVNSKVLSPAYLKTMEEQYKEKYLKEMSKHSEVLIYDWSEGGDNELILDDIEKIDFERDLRHETVFKDWDKDEWEFSELRHHFSNFKDGLMGNTYVPAYDVPELCIDPDQVRQYWLRRNEAPGEEFLPGYNRKMGDPSVYLGTNYDSMLLPKIERRTTFTK